MSGQQVATYASTAPTGQSGTAAATAAVQAQRAVAWAASTRYPGIFGGLTFVDGGTQAVVHLTSLDPAVLSALTKTNDGATAPTFVRTSHTYAEQPNISAALARRFDSLFPAGGIKSWVPDPDSGLLQVGITARTKNSSADAATAQRTLDKAFGAGTTKAFIDDRVSIPTDSRRSDSPAWNGGDFISDDTSSDCSSGFGMHRSDNGHSYLLTAAHCYSVGTVVHNNAYFLSSSSVKFGNDQVIGTVTNRDTAPSGIDVELIDTTSHGGSSNRIWGGSTTSPVARTVTGIATGANKVAVGQYVQATGAFEGETEAAYVTAVDGCFVVNGRRACGQATAVQQSGHVIIGEGDSGGPVWRNNGGVEMEGVISTLMADSAHPASNCANYSNYPRIVANGGRVCGSIMTFTSIDHVTLDFGFTLSPNL